MAHLLNIWTPVSARLGRADKVLLLFDYDGTLTPIVQRPEDALLSGETRDLLQSAAALPKFVVGIVSGRGLEDLSKLANIPGLIHAGNHGMEIRGQGIEFTHPGAVASRAILDRAEHILLEALGSVPGVIVEHKGLTLTVHYRAVDAGSLGEGGVRRYRRDIIIRRCWRTSPDPGKDGCGGAACYPLGQGPGHRENSGGMRGSAPAGLLRRRQDR